MTAPQTQLPLQRHMLLQTTDLDEARARVAEVFCPHRLDITDKGPFAARHHHLPGQALSLNYIEYGARTRILPGELGGFYLLQIPLVGGAQIRHGGQDYTSTPHRAAVLNPHLPTKMEWAEGTRQVLVQIRRQAMQAHLTAHMGAPSDRPLTFTGPLDLTHGAGLALRRLVLWLVAEADGDVVAPLGSGLMARQIESTILSGLLEAGGHDHSGQLGRLRDAPRPRHLRLAEGFIAAHLDQPITLEDVADAAGISPRGLQMAFRPHRDTTPLAFWREARLARAHADLLTARPGTTVTEVALRWGFRISGGFPNFTAPAMACARATACALGNRRPPLPRTGETTAASRFPQPRAGLKKARKIKTGKGRTAMVHIIVVGNEKGGSGKSTTCMHVGTALARMGHRVGALDLDLRQRSFGRYVENRRAFLAKNDLTLPSPDYRDLPEIDPATVPEGENVFDHRLSAAIAALEPVSDFIVIDCPGSHTRLSQVAHSLADTLITPLNDSFVDFDLLARIDPETNKVKGPSIYSEMVWAARQARAQAGLKPIDWIVLRNRLGAQQMHNKKKVGAALEDLSKRIGFRVAPGFTERVIFRELFPRGLTLLDLKDTGVEQLNMSNIAARQELRDLMAELKLPGATGGF